MGRSEQYKVLAWGPGYTGAQALREIDRRPELQLIGCLAYSPAKAGRDAMELIGEPPGDIPVVTDKNAIHDLAADVVLYAGRSLPDETSRRQEITTLLGSGKNVFSSTTYFFPWQRGVDYVAPWRRHARPAAPRCTAPGSTPAGSPNGWPWRR